MSSFSTAMETKTKNPLLHHMFLVVRKNMKYIMYFSKYNVQTYFVMGSHPTYDILGHIL